MHHILHFFLCWNSHGFDMISTKIHYFIYMHSKVLHLYNICCMNFYYIHYYTSIRYISHYKIKTWRWEICDTCHATCMQLLDRTRKWLCDTHMRYTHEIHTWIIDHDSCNMNTSVKLSIYEVQNSFDVLHFTVMKTMIIILFLMKTITKN